MHPRVCARTRSRSCSESTAAFVDHCRGDRRAARDAGDPTADAARRAGGGAAGARRRRARGGDDQPSLRHVPEPGERRPGRRPRSCCRLIDIAATLGAQYALPPDRRARLADLGSGGRALRRARRCPVPGRRRERGVTLLVENASALNADIHIAHTLADTIALAEIAGIGVCIELSRLLVRSRPRENSSRARCRSPGWCRSATTCSATASRPAARSRATARSRSSASLGDVLDAGYAGVVRPRAGRSAHRSRRSPSPPPRRAAESVSRQCSTTWERERWPSATDPPTKRCADAWHRFCDQLKDAGDKVFKDANPAAPLLRADAFRFLTPEPRPGLRSRAGDQGSGLSADPPVLHADAQARRRRRRLHLSPGLDRRQSRLQDHRQERHRTLVQPDRAGPASGRRSPAPTGRACTSRSATSRRRNIFGHQIKTDADGKFRALHRRRRNGPRTGCRPRRARGSCSSARASTPGSRRRRR